MSTKSTIAHGPTFHLHNDVGDERYVYLELESVPFYASYDKVVVPIPVHIWETIRSHPGVDLSLADASDDDIRKRVELAVDGRSASYEAAETDQQQALADLLGFIPYGAARDPRDQQIARGLDYYNHRREHQRQICAAIERLNSKESTSHAQRRT